MACGTIAALAGTLGGTGLQELANSQTQSQMNSLTAQELARQQQFAKQGQNVFQQSLGQSTPMAAGQQIGQGQQQALSNIQNVQGSPLSLSMPASSSINTAGNVARQNMSNQNAAGFQGYSNFPLQQRLKDLSANSQLGLIGSQAQQSEGVLPYELQQAQGSQSGLRALGQLLSAGGMLAGLGGLTSAPTGLGSVASQQGTNMALNGAGMTMPLSFGGIPYWYDPMQGGFVSQP